MIVYKLINFRGDTYMNNTIKKFIDFFFNKNFFIFIVIGVINTFNGAIISFLLSSLLKLQGNVAFIIGYILSLAIAYILNSVFNFKEKLSFERFIKFAISYIPNFIIQNVVVFIVFNIMKLPNIVAYIIAAILGIPITFVFLKIFAFKKKEKN